jgi:hypothetical protein
LVYFAATIYRYVYLVETRLLLPMFPLLCLAAAFALDRLSDWDHKVLRLSRVMGGIVVVVLGANLMTETGSFLAIHPLEPLVGLESREGYLARRLGAYLDAMRYANENLPAGAHILFLSEPRSYYSQHPALGDATLDNLAQLQQRYGDADVALAALRDEGFTHLLFYRAGLSFLLGSTPRPPTLASLFGSRAPEQPHYPLTEADLRFLETLLSHCRLEADLASIYQVYRIPDAGP